MSASNTFESDVLKLIFQNVAATLIGDAAGLLGSTVAGSLYISLHTADPGEAGNQTSNETAYTNYVRVAVGRGVGTWTVSGTAPTQVANAADITFATCGVTGATLTHFGVGTDAAGAGKLLFSGALTSPLVVANGTPPPKFIAGDLVVTCD